MLRAPWSLVVPAPRFVKPGRGLLRLRPARAATGTPAIIVVTVAVVEVGAHSPLASTVDAAVEAAQLLCASQPSGLRWQRVDGTALVRVVFDRTIPAAGYRATVKPDGIHIVTADTEGTASALALVCQALMIGAHRASAGREVDLPCVTVEDRPSNSWRGFMLDVARHFFPFDSLLRWPALLWLLRLNRFHLHLTDDQGWRVPVDGYPKLISVGAWRPEPTSEATPYGGAYTVGQLQRLDHFAARLGITVVPEIDVPGHCSAAITAYPELGCSGRAPGVETRWGIFNAVLCQSSPHTERFLRAVFAAVAETFGGPYIHVGGDEVLSVAWRECARCGPHTRAAEGTDRLYRQAVFAAVAAAQASGRRALVWDEAARLDLPPETIVCNWREPIHAFEAIRRGHQVVVCPQQHRTYLDHSHSADPLEPGRLNVCTVVESATFEPHRHLRESIGTGTQIGLLGDAELYAAVLGGQGNLWTEAVQSHRQAEYMSVVRLAALAEGLWTGTPGADRIDDFVARLEALRATLFAHGVNVYPGPLQE